MMGIGIPGLLKISRILVRIQLPAQALVPQLGRGTYLKSRLSAGSSPAGSTIWRVASMGINGLENRATFMRDGSIPSFSS